MSNYDECDICGKRFAENFIQDGVCVECTKIEKKELERKKEMLKNNSSDIENKNPRSKVASCWRCKEPVGSKNLKRKWIRELSEQRLLCPDCISAMPASTRTGKPAEYKMPAEEYNGIREKAGKVIEKQSTSGIEKSKPCFYCDSKLFRFYGNGKFRCNSCNREYQI